VEASLADARRAAWIAVRGIVSGILYYILFVIALPALTKATSTQQTLTPTLSTEYLVYLGILTGLGVGAALARGTPAAIPMNLLTSLVSWLIAYKLLSGGILHGSLGGISVTVDVRPMLYTVLALTLLYGLASGLETMSPTEK
jgi:hypothetical protein